MGVFTSVDPAQVLRTSISFSCWVFASYLFPVLVSVVYYQYLFQEDSMESDRWVLDRPGRMTQIETSIRLWIPSRWPISFCCTDFVQLYSFSILCWYLQYQWFFSMLVAYHQYMCILSVSIAPYFLSILLECWWLGRRCWAALFVSFHL